MSTKRKLRSMFFACIFVLVNTLLNNALAQKSKKLDVFGRLPILDGESYRCDDMAIVVNYLRDLGKDEALQLIREYNNQTHGVYNNELILVCRCLFVKPDGWAPVRFGQVVPPVNESALKCFSHFPIAFSNGIPFLIIRGYRLHGRGEGLFQYLETCENLRMRETGMPRAGYQEAAQQLIEKSEFHALYISSEEEKDIAGLIMGQANKRYSRASPWVSIQNNETSYSKDMVCAYWQSAIDPAIILIPGMQIDQTKPENILAAIQCLLSLKGNKNEAKIHGSTRPEVSAFFLDPCPVEIAALFYATYLFYGQTDFAQAIVLMEKKSG